MGCKNVATRIVFSIVSYDQSEKKIMEIHIIPDRLFLDTK